MTLTAPQKVSCSIRLIGTVFVVCPVRGLCIGWRILLSSRRVCNELRRGIGHVRMECQTLVEQSRRIEVSVWRGSGKSGNLERFEVPAHESQTVLDVVSWIQQYADPTLAYRFACRAGVCGSCAMMVNGLPRWTCRTHVDRVAGNGSLRIEPLRNLPVIRDLVVDMDPFFDKWIRAEALHHPSRSREDDLVHVDPASDARQKADAGIECINCGVCYAACDTVAGSPEYLGPAALLRAWTVVNDSRDSAHNTVLDAISGPGGCHNCHSIGSCQQRCPMDLNPLAAIAGLKRATAKRALTGTR